MCAGSAREPTGALLSGRPRGPHGHPDKRAPTPPDRRQETPAHSRRRSVTLRQGHTDPAAHRHSGALLPAATRPQGTRNRARAPRYLHVVDDGLEEPAQGAALLLRRLHARAGRQQGAGGAQGAGPGEPGRGGCLLRGPAGPAASGPLSAAGRAALRGRGPPRGGAGHVAAGLAAARGARRGQLAAQPRRGD